MIDSWGTDHYPVIQFDKLLIFYLVTNVLIFYLVIDTLTKLLGFFSKLLIF